MALRQRLKADLSLALATLLWGVTFVVVNDAVSRASVFLFLTLRFGLAAILLALEPVFAAGTSYLLVGERLGGRALLGAGLVLLGIVVAELKGPAPAAPESAEPAAGAGN